MNQIRLRRNAALQRVAIVLSVVYLTALALIAFWPTPVDQGAHTYLMSLLGWLQRHGAPTWLGYGFVEFAANIALFVPVGLLGVILLRARRWWLAIFAGFFASCCIELGQLMFLPERFATVRDVVANTGGTIIGTMLALIVLGLVHVLPSTDERPPTARRMSTRADKSGVLDGRS
ncbi:VanZ family protein [Cryobacterium sp. CG_9.6]|uniref:VanZ family protein n=1 Tax=Cryobacterium sp. CG_9.6 TaxID=2760710 RepID=UPI002473FACC|nr:VanZ family protein [Cryobacterium sp. CG_9.6]MDH6235826.1 glycopeptide antibiotics resistance protein [Cryobacterium sp. CG_9.6]